MRNNTNTKEKAAPVQPGTATNTNDKQHTGCRCVQQTLFDLPAPERCEGPLEAYLRARPGWHDRQNVAAALGISDRELRLQSEFSNGLIIFGSQKGRGLQHAIHADTFELRACKAELIQRARAHFRRADEIETVIQQREVGE